MGLPIGENLALAREGLSAPPRREEPHAERIRRQQIESLYATATPGVIGALVAGLILLATMAELGVASRLTLEIYLATLFLCIGNHMTLGYLFARADERSKASSVWPRGYVCAAFLGGIWWGSTTLFLAPRDRFDLQVMTMGIAFIIAMGAIPAFGNYLPAFRALFFPTVGLAIVAEILRGGALDYAAALLSSVLLVTGAELGRGANAIFTQLLRLRFEKDALAEDLRAQKDLAEQASLSKSRFLAAASHDLRQPIHALSLFVGALSRREMDDETRRLVLQIEASVESMDGLFASLLDISRLDAGVVRPRLRSFPIAPMLERICADHAAAAQGKGLSLKLLTSRAHVHSDPALLERILRNFVSNAVRHTIRGRVLVGCRLGRRLRLEVWDTGPGVAPEHRQRIFDEFFQVENAERDRGKGLGLGLAIVKRLASLLDHPVEFESRVGRGSVFKISVPIADVPALAPAPAEAAIPSLIAGSFILVVDDETMVREAMRNLLTSWGAEVIVAESFASMLEKIATRPTRPDLIVCDYRLRGEENGVDVIRQLRAEYNDDVPAILITGDTGSERLREVQQSGFLVLHKPVATGKLRATIGNLLRRRRAEVEAEE